MPRPRIRKSPRQPDDGDALVVNDNDGVDDSNGETQLLHFEELFDD